MEAPFADVVVFARDWGFRLAEVTIPVHVWHGDADWIIPHSHGEHVARRLPSATFSTLPGDSHLSGLEMATDILSTLLREWDTAST